LREPPRGRHWVIVDGRYLLVTDDNFRIEIIR
jgi:Ni/Co efflux regulator RcnB